MLPYPKEWIWRFFQLGLGLGLGENLGKRTIWTGCERLQRVSIQRNDSLNEAEDNPNRKLRTWGVKSKQFGDSTMTFHGSKIVPISGWLPTATSPSPAGSVRLGFNFGSERAKSVKKPSQSLETPAISTVVQPSQTHWANLKFTSFG